MPRWLACTLLLGAACGRTPEPAPVERAAAAVVSAPQKPATSADTGSIAPADLPGKKADHGAPGSKIKHVIVIAMENHDADQIYADPVNAPYIRSLVESYAHAENFDDELPLEIPSEGHYVWMESGTHQFSDALFDDDSPPSPAVSTGSNQHLVRQIKNADTGLSWMTYQEGMNEETGACPIHRSGFYVPKHNPFVFFRDVAGDPPATDTPYCAAHHKPYSALQADLTGELASYVFITPDECHDMHGQRGCPEENPIRTGDQWLKAELPRLIAYAAEHHAVIFITFDEGGSTPKLPFIAVGTMVKPHYAGTERYSHSSQLKSVELILGLEPLPRVANSNDLSDLFKAGAYP
ncbi:MAG: alkaline phosphatase family protein [Pseudomonadota bacterium]